MIFFIHLHQGFCSLGALLHVSSLEGASWAITGLLSRIKDRYGGLPLAVKVSGLAEMRIISAHSLTVMNLMVSWKQNPILCQKGGKLPQLFLPKGNTGWTAWMALTVICSVCMSSSVFLGGHWLWLVTHLSPKLSIKLGKIDPIFLFP